MRIDRFEGETAVIECGELFFELPRSVLPPNTREGDILSISIDSEATEQKKAELKKRLGTLFQRQ
ncbi:MAG: DUF3006 domain-containing protein [Clostridia bacterium]|nr:DUF3006 domain-containing protein [Clostridia bacterium]